MRATKDANLDLSTLPELILIRDELLPKIEDNTATVREARKFVQLHSIIMLFQNAKIACQQIRKVKARGGSIGNHVMQEMVNSERKSSRTDPFLNPVIR